MSHITFKPSSANSDNKIPHHCDQPLRFGVLTCCCGVCGVRYDTVEITLGIMIANGIEPDPVKALVESTVFGIIAGRPLDAIGPEKAPSSPDASLAAEKLAREAIFKAAGK